MIRFSHDDHAPQAIEGADSSSSEPSNSTNCARYINRSSQLPWLGLRVCHDSGRLPGKKPQNREIQSPMGDVWSSLVFGWYCAPHAAGLGRARALGLRSASLRRMVEFETRHADPLSAHFGL